jgi:DNA-directed RNA polymerase subunit omega
VGRTRIGQTRRHERLSIRHYTKDHSLLIYPSADTIEDKVKSRYSLVVLSAKRAKQIKEGAPVLIETTSTNPLTIALEEIAAGKVTATEVDGDLVPQAAGTPGVAPTAALPDGRAEKLTTGKSTTEKTTMEEPGDDDAEGA